MNYQFIEKYVYDFVEKYKTDKIINQLEIKKIKNLIYSTEVSESWKNIDSIILENIRQDIIKEFPDANEIPLDSFYNKNKHFKENNIYIENTIRNIIHKKHMHT